MKEQIRRSVDLVDLISEHVTLKRAGRNLRGLCPFHRENTPSFNVLPDRQIFKCFGCGAGGDVFKFVQLREGVDFPEAIRILADRIGLRLEAKPAGPAGPQTIGRADIARVNEWAAKWFHQELLSDRGASARAYLEKRRISREAAELFQIGAALTEGRLAESAGRAGFSMNLLLAADLFRTGERGGAYETFRDRLMFPIRDASRRCVGFGGRTLSNAPAKYLNTAQTPLFDKSGCLFGMDHARNEIGQRGEAIIVEGYTDCIACHQHGFKHVIATLGTAATDEHMSLLRRYADNVVLFFDSDAAGDAAAERAAAIAMQRNLRVRLARVPEGKDPAEFLETSGPDGFSQVLNSAVDALGFLWGRTLARFQNPLGGQGRRKAVDEFIQMVGELSRFRAVDAIQRGLIINQVAHLLGLPVHEVGRMFPAAKESQNASRVERANSAGAAAGDVEQMALAELLGVLLCRPDLWEQATGVLRAACIADEALRFVVEECEQMIAESGSIETAVVVAAIESPEIAARVTDLMLKASERGNFEETLAGLRERLTLIEAERPGRAASEALLAAPDDDGSRPDVDSQLAALHEGYSRRHHFSPKALCGTGGR